ncbi:MAG: hypothetical protein LIO67_04690, partial [Lachnospiraceae bacterium]|nr:hypothetical protein [Lachnospiraceae bacterium]
CHVVILGMERLDADACRKLQEKLSMPVSNFLSSDHNCREITAVLRQLSMLVTSRYHAEVLSMDAQVPGIAVSMDERLDNLMQEVNLCEHQLLHADDRELALELMRAMDYVYSHLQQIKEKTGCQLVRYQNTLDEMGDFLISWLLSHGSLS